MNSKAYETVRRARDNKRPTGGDYLRGMLSGFTELHGDRRFGDDSAIIGGVGWLGQLPVTAIAVEKGHGARERAARNSGAPHPEGYRKALRLMKQAEKFHRPVLCVVDTSGAYCGVAAEERGQGQAIAENLTTMMALETPVLTLLIGEGGSGGALALSVADQVWMLENTIYSVISPEGCASILWRDSTRVGRAAECLRLTAQDALTFGVADQLVSEANLGDEVFYRTLRRMLETELKNLLLLPMAQLLEDRYQRFRRFGTDPTASTEGKEGLPDTLPQSGRQSEFGKESIS